MGERTSYAPGTFSWTDLGTTDADAAKAFYTGLFGWQPNDLPAGEGVTYTMLQLGGRNVAALYQMTEAPHPAWLSYVTVEDAAASAARAKDLGATVISEPFDVLEAGRMAVLQDPTGAVFAVWEPRESIGAELVNDEGAMSLNQLNTSDPPAAQRFYGELFGWRIESVGTPEQEYWGIYNGDAMNGGMMPLPPEAGAPSHWLVYFTHQALDTAVTRIGELGGTVLVPPTAIPSGRFLVAHDPQGAVFALFEGRVDP
jgi:predicted enzyme related to lactoylglutathione lyase